MTRPKVESFSSRPWSSRHSPDRVLFIRFHAIGDVAITLPYVTGFVRAHPTARVDYLTTPAAIELPGALDGLSHIETHAVGTDRLERFIGAMRTGFLLRQRAYDIIIDLQRNWISRIIRRLAMPTAWSEFDRFGPMPAGDRVSLTIERAGFPGLQKGLTADVKPEVSKLGVELLVRHGWTPGVPLICLNPAGLWSSRQWPLASYSAVADILMRSGPFMFLLLGTERMQAKASSLSATLGARVINLVGQTTLTEALAAVRLVSVCLTEDSGLMHMSWISGVPTIALFGSSRFDWSRPLGPRSVCLHSGDLPCGACMTPDCRFGDVHCLTRYSPEDVAEKIYTLLRVGERPGDV